MRAIYLLLVCLALSRVAISAEPATTLTRKELQAYSDVQKKLYPKKGDLYRKVVDLFGYQDSYTVAQVTAVTDPYTKETFNYSQRQNEHREGTPLGAFSRTEAQDHLAEYEKLHPKAQGLWGILVTNYGDHAWYRADELRDVEDNKKIGAREQPGSRATNDPVQQAYMAGRSRDKSFREGFRGLLIRQSWRDVLYADDPSQKGNASKSLKDLVGANLSYAHDGIAHADTWSANGAVLFPWVWRNGSLDSGLKPSQFAVAPSVSVNRVDTDGDPKKEADSMLFRLGTYWSWYLPGAQLSSVQLRAAGVYATDTGFRGDLPGYEIDLEPQWPNEILPLGYKLIVIPKKPVREDEIDKSLLDLQLRLWLHAEGGDVQNTGKSWDPSKGTFFRLGPSAQLQLNAPQLVFGKDFSVTGLYSYLSAISGSDEHNSFLKLSAALDLFKDEELNRKVSIAVEYQRGGLTFTKEDVDTITVGLGILF